MIDITKCKQIFYGEDRSVIVFQDHDPEKSDTWYMVPVPRLRGTASDPAFALTRYMNATGDVAGMCTFQVELHIPEEARKEAERQIGGTVVWGQFTWVGGDSMFTYEIEGDPKSQIVSPTLFGSNVASYQIELPSHEAVQTFVNAFSGDGQVSPFQVDYQMTVLTELLGARATVQYDSTVAIDYQRKYEERSTTWGSESVLVEVRQVLKRSGAGKVDVVQGAGGSPETTQRVRDWAWSTLEQEVAANVATAQAMATGPNPVSASTSFTRSYEENAIIEWTTPVTAMLPKFDAATWKKVYTEVDNRELAVTFTLAGELFDPEGMPVFQNVVVTVDYPTRTQDNTFSLIAGDNDLSSKQYKAKGFLKDGKFVPDYRYKFQVYYASGKPYESDWIESSATRVELRPADFGLSQVRFVASNVPFASSGASGDPAMVVDRVFVDFFFVPPNGHDALVQCKEIVKNGIDGAAQFVSKFNAPIGQEYSFRLRYLMKSGLVVVAQPESRFGGNNADVVQVLDPRDQITQFNLRAFNMQSPEPAFMLIEVNGQYHDVQNRGDDPIASHDWSWEPDPSIKMDTAPAWSFQATPNPDTAYFKLAGQIVFADGSDFQLDNYYSPANRRSLILYSDSYYYSVKVETSRVDWNTVSAVYVNLFQLELTEEELERLGSLPAYYLKPRHALTLAQRLEVDQSRLNVQRFDLLAAVKDAPRDDFTRYYNIRRRRTEAKTAFLYNADYIMKDGSIRSIGNDEVVDKLLISLPPTPEGESSGAPLLRVLTEADLPRARAQRG